MHDCCLCGRRHREPSLFSLSPAERQELGIVVKLEHPLLRAWVCGPCLQRRQEKARS